jgi:hypothetical protein
MPELDINLTATDAATGNTLVRRNEYGDASFAQLNAGTIGAGSVTTIGDVNSDNVYAVGEMTANTIRSGGELVETQNRKDATGGYAGLTLFKINFKNALNTFTSFFTNSNTASRTYTFQDRDGTIADLSDISRSIRFNIGTFNPADNATYYAGGSDAAATTTSDASHVVLADFTGNITEAYISLRYSGTASSELVTFAMGVNKTTYTTLTTLNFTVGTTQCAFVYVTGLSIPVVKGQYLNLRISVPALATNPTIVYGTAVLKGQ